MRPDHAFMTEERKLQVSGGIGMEERKKLAYNKSKMDVVEKKRR